MNDDMAAELMAEDDEVGELLDIEHLSAWDSEFSPGDLVHFCLRHRHAEPGQELLGFVRAVAGGHELAYLVDVVKESPPTWELWVSRRDILRAWTP